MTLQSDNKTLDQIRPLPPSEALPLLDVYIQKNPGDDEALTLRGLKYWAMGNRREAINNYLAALEINPESKAKMALQVANSILDYYNKDLLNP